MRHDLQRVAVAVEDHVHVGEVEHRVGHVEVVVERGRQAFEVAHGVVGEEADRPAREARQAGQVDGTARLDKLVERVERVVARQRLDRGRPSRA